MGDARTSVSFACQRCLQPVIIEDSFDNMSVHALAELAREYQTPLFHFTLMRTETFIFSFVPCTDDSCSIFFRLQCPYTQTRTLNSIPRPLALTISFLHSG